MSEKNLVIDGMELKYKGLFKVNSLLKEIDKSLKAKGYEKAEKRREERITPSGKELRMEFRPLKKKAEYFTLMVKMRLEILNLKDVEVLRDKVKTKMNQGNIKIIFDAWTITDYEARWEQKPLFVFFRTLFEKGIYKFHTGKYHDELINDTHFIYNNIKAYLELHKF